MIMVPPMLKIHNIAADQKLAKPSEKGRVPITANDMSIRSTVKPRIEYLTEDYAKNKKLSTREGNAEEKQRTES
jgi:hypothetical protein